MYSPTNPSRQMTPNFMKHHDGDDSLFMDRSIRPF